MTEETQPNKIDIVKEMVFNECLERNYIRKHQKENRYITNINKKDFIFLSLFHSTNIAEFICSAIIGKRHPISVFH